MRKFFISLTAISTIMASVSAQSLTGLREVAKRDIFVNSEKVFILEELEKMKDNGLNSIFNNVHSSASYSGSYKSAGSYDEPIVQKPKGTLISNAYATARGYYPYWGYAYQAYSDGLARDMVEDGSSFYIKNPFSRIITNTWLKGTKKQTGTAGVADTVVVSLPQPIYRGNVQDADGNLVTKTLYAYNLIITKDDEGKSVYKSAESQQVEFTWNGDTLRKLGNEILALTDENGNWYTYGDDSIVIHRQKDVPAKLAATGIKTKYALTYNLTPEKSDYKILNAIREEGGLFIGDLMGKQGLWAKGISAGDKMIFEKQYLGIDTTLLYHVYYIPAEVEFEYDKTYGKYNLKALPVDRLEYAYDTDKDSLGTDGAFFVNYGKNVLNANNVYLSSCFTKWEDRAYKPQAPYNIYVDTEPTGSVTGILQFDLHTTDAGGSLLDADNMFYSVYFNDADHAYTFARERYKNLTEDMTEVPAAFTDNWDFAISGGKTYNVYFYESDFTDMARIGIKAIYKGGNAINSSEISWKDITAGIMNGNTDNGSIRSVCYFDMTGRRVASPATGLYIKTVRYADGTVKGMKMAR